VGKTEPLTTGLVKKLLVSFDLALRAAFYQKLEGNFQDVNPFIHKYKMQDLRDTKRTHIHALEKMTMMWW
jgi:hypothetical protein